MYIYIYTMKTIEPWNGLNFIYSEGFHFLLLTFPHFLVELSVNEVHTKGGECLSAFFPFPNLGLIYILYPSLSTLNAHLKLYTLFYVITMHPFKCLIQSKLWYINHIIYVYFFRILNIIFFLGILPSLVYWLNQFFLHLYFITFFSID